MLQRPVSLETASVQRIVGSTANGDAALIKLETETRIIDLIIRRSDLPSMLAAVIYAHQLCLTKSATNDAVTFALPTDDIEIELLTDATILMMVALPGGQKIAFKVLKDSANNLQQRLQQLVGS